MKIFKATWLEDNQGDSLTKVGAKCRLMSFFFLSQFDSKIIRDYDQEGRVSSKMYKKEKK